MSMRTIPLVKNQPNETKEGIVHGNVSSAVESADTTVVSKANWCTTSTTRQSMLIHMVLTTTTK